MPQPTPEQAAQLAKLSALASRPQLPGSQALLQEAWALFRANALRLIGISLLGLLPMLLVPLLFVAGMTAGSAITAVAAGIAMFVLALAIAVWSGAASLLLLLRPDAAKDVPSAFVAARPFLLAFLWVAVLQSALAFGGLFLFLVGSVVFSVLAFFAPLILVDENLRGMRAIVKSRELMRGRTWRVAGYFLLIGFVFWVASLVVSGIPALLGASKDAVEFFNGVFGIVAGPFAICYQVVLYRHVKASAPDIGAFPKPGQMKWYWIVACLGPVMAALIVGGLATTYKTLSEFSKEMDVGQDMRSPLLDELYDL